MEKEIQFDEVQRPAGATVCSACRKTLTTSYYQANGQILCEECAGKIRDYFHSGNGEAGRYVTAAVLGIGGGIAGGAVYTAVLALIHINAALITILIGWLVGKGVRKGSGGRGGVGYQILAVAITYWMIGLSIMFSAAFSGAAAGLDTMTLVVVCIKESFAAPIMDATSSILGALITFFGLMQAWRLNGEAKIAISGPHAIAMMRPTAVQPVATPPSALPPTLPTSEPPPTPSA